jgi:hypothetical protein
MVAELIVLVSICAQEPGDAANAPRENAPAPSGSVMPADAPRATPAPTRADRVDEVDRLLDALLSGPSPSSWHSEPAPAVLAEAQPAKDALVVTLRTHARVTSDYVRLNDIAELNRDPEGLAAFVGTIVICPAPDLEKVSLIARDKIAQRLEEYGLALNRFMLIGARQVLIARVKAGHEGDTEEKDAGAAPDEAVPAPAPPPAAAGGVKRGAAVTIVREGALFKTQEAGTALADAAAGEHVKVNDTKGRPFSGRVTGNGIVTISLESGQNVKH